MGTTSDDQNRQPDNRAAQPPRPATPPARTAQPPAAQGARPPARPAPAPAKAPLPTAALAPVAGIPAAKPAVAAPAAVPVAAIRTDNNDALAKLRAKERRRQHILLAGAGAAFVALCVGVFVGIRSFKQTAHVAPAAIPAVTPDAVLPETPGPETPETPAAVETDPAETPAAVEPVPAKTPEKSPPKGTSTPKTKGQETTSTETKTVTPAGKEFSPRIPARTPEPPPAAEPELPRRPLPAPKADPLPDPAPKKDPPAAVDAGAFALFPRNIELPPLVGGLGKAVVLGKIAVGPEGKLRLDLREGVEGSKSPATFRLEAEAGDEPQWTVLASPPPVKKTTSAAQEEGPAPVAYRVARFKLAAEGLLEFAWLDEAVSIAATALRNCLIDIEVREGGKTTSRVLGLRVAQVSSFSKLDPTKDEMTIPIKGEALPERASFRLQLVELRGFPDDVVCVPAHQTVAHREQLRVVVRPATTKEPGIEIRFWIESLASGSVMKIGALAVDAKGETLPFSRDRVEFLSKTIPRELKEGQEDLLKMQAEYRNIEAESTLVVGGDAQAAGRAAFAQKAKQKRLARVADNIVDKKKRMAYLANLNKILPDLVTTSGELQENAQFDFRVFYTVGDREVDILTTR